MKTYVFALTGATGSVLGIRVLREVVKISEVHLLISSQSFPIIFQETGVDWHGDTEEAVQRKVRETLHSEHIHYYHEMNLSAPASSGSFKTEGMFIVPCSMKTLSGVAHGYTENLIQRAADVTIKEGRPLVISPREMPFSAIHLENMLKLARLGVRIVPPVMGFYHKPRTIEDMVDFAAGKILDLMGIEQDIFRRWGT
ncbi:MAG: phenylacrylic acid decarboxylase [Nitrospirae bacterium]|jgi:4-hydroxy-3-polyprenylbenzoate decarboxylase|nr:phenylacrylic acid decarboxylase [Nitrospirota bacterium]MBS1126150.1 phenylacrylic acid decarboxylase [Nitrospirota bacterium]MBS1234711.1 phenylacrylic acid decarboxylase [Nitrospirota bacterium]